MELNQCKAGDVVYICDYRFNDIDNKPIRHVRPQKVAVVSNDELPKNKRVYYSTFHFRPIAANGKVKSQIIAPYDNTGYRAYTGVPVQVFDNEADCVAYYNERCKAIIEQFEHAKVSKMVYYDDMIATIRAQMMEVSNET